MGLGMLNPEPETRGREPGDWQAPEEMQMANKHVKRPPSPRNQRKAKIQQTAIFHPSDWQTF